MAVGIGTGTTLAHGALSGGMTGIAHSGSTRPSIPVPHLGTTVTVPKVAGALRDWGSVTAEVLLDPAVDLANFLAQGVAAVADLVITFPDATVFTAAASFITDIDLFGVPLEDAMTASVTFELNTLPVLTG